MTPLQVAILAGVAYAAAKLAIVLTGGGLP